MKLHDTVALLEDIPALNLYRGQVGTIVKEYEPGVFEVEFSDFEGRTYALETLQASQLMLLRYQFLEEMTNILQLVEEIRKLIYRPYEQDTLLQDDARWNMLCSCLDVIEDTDCCLEAFLRTDIDRFDCDQHLEDGNKYMYVYGTLQALYLQQDAFTHLTESLPSTKSFKMPCSLDKIREIRNASIGHPTKQDRPAKVPVRFNFISRVSIGNQGFKLGTTYEDDRSDCFKDVNIPELIATQRRIFIGVLKNIIETLEKEGVA